MRSFSRWVVGLSLLCLLPGLLALNGAGEEPKAAEPVRAFSAQSGTNTPVPTASATATTTETPASRPPDAPCPGGPGIWLPSSLDQKQFNDKLALELMYGSDSIAVCPVQDMYQWEPKQELEGHPYFAYLTPYLEGYPTQSVHTVAFIAAVTNERKERQYIAVTEAVLFPGATHQLWGGVFQRVGTEWKTVVSPGFITELMGDKAGLGDTADDRKLVQVGPHRYGVLLRDGYGTQGYIWTETILITEVNGRLKKVFSADVAGDYNGGCDPDSPDDYCYAYDSYIRFCESSTTEYWPLYLYTTGTEPAPEDHRVIRDASKVQVYEFQNGAYSLVLPDNQGTTCAPTCQAATTATPTPTSNPVPSVTDILSNADETAILESLKRPEVIALRKAMDAYASGQRSPYLEEWPLEPWREWSAGLLPHRDLFTSKFALLAVEPNLIRGVDLHIVAQNRPEKVFIAWMTKTGNTWKLVRFWESKASDDMERRRIAAYKQLLSDPELGF